MVKKNNFYLVTGSDLLKMKEQVPDFILNRANGLFTCCGNQFYIDNNLIQGQVFAIFVITVAAAEAAVGLAILLSLYRNRVTVDMESFNLLKW